MPLCLQFMWWLGWPSNRISISHHIGSVYWPNRSLNPKFLEIWCFRFSGNLVQSSQICLKNEKMFSPYITVKFSNFFLWIIWGVVRIKVSLSEILNFDPISIKFHQISSIFMIFFDRPNLEPQSWRVPDNFQISNFGVLFIHSWATESKIIFLKFHKISPTFRKFRFKVRKL